MANLLRSAFLILGTLVVSSSAAAQAARTGTASEVVDSRRDQLDVGTTTAAPRSASHGPLRAVPFNSAPAVLQRKSEPAVMEMRARPRMVGAVLGGVVGGAIGFAAGYELDNVERAGGGRVGSATLVGTASGIVVGALLGSAVGWLIER